ncbi:MAG TPA: hypothetical protein VJX10_09465, partial [Pseudonocardiaceae bacterium]|nr:hypothetical protein [Pseudonocardiaceae bacterium]
VKPGDIVKVKVLDVDIPRKRISLTLRLEDEPGRAAPERRTSGGKQRRPRQDDRPAPGGAMADALRRAGFDDNRDDGRRR